MQIAFLLLVGLIGVSPAFLLFDSLIIQGLLTAFAAITIMIVALSIRPGEAEYFSKLIRRAALIAVIPPVWMLIQILPIPIDRLIHPIWLSARGALDQSVIGSISIDRGATLVAFVRYCCVAGVAFIAAAVTIDRLRAEFVLLWLAGLTTLAALLLIVIGLGQIDLFGMAISPDTSISITALAALGVILNTTAAIRTIERYETRRTTPDASFSRFLSVLSICAVALIICLSTIILFSPAQIIFATLSGLTMFLLITLIRRLGLRLWENAVIVVVAMSVMVVVAIAHWQPGDLTLQYAITPAPVNATAQSILSDTSWLGNGAGAFPSILPIYGGVDNVASGPYAPTTAATIVIEMGRPAFWAILVMAVLALILLFRGALQRGRDSFYSAAGASCIVLLIAEAFCDASALATPVAIITAVIFGLSLSQSESRTGQLRFGVG